ncbi:hypothetical protein HFP15_22655 [Amycolatopsis sp. K13G38]|uniref:Uncharacterized protein n=1 Tax=Amycolatopsis acididurans TaxID=2724524 RepID=A0ABX1J7Z1_9PSEU|nr:hypothetical protein [Amycolatopsis acididurans]NKQ55684.1 hypothetical protein [Amycolatopsis acididurans]
MDMLDTWERALGPVRGLSRFLRLEEAFDVNTGHAAMITVVEDFLRKIEGERDQAPG